MVNVMFVAFVVLATSMGMLSCSAKANLDKMCKHMFVPEGMSTECVPVGECGIDSPGEVAMNCTKPGTVCCVTGLPTRPAINFDALCYDIYVHDNAVTISCVNDTACGTDGSSEIIFDCSSEGQVCCMANSAEPIDYDEICGDVYIPVGTGLSVGCIEESECGTNGPLGPLFQCNTAGEVCCMSGTAPGTDVLPAVNYDVVCDAVYEEGDEVVECVEEATCIGDGGGVLFPCSKAGEVCCMTGIPVPDINPDIICIELFVPEGIAMTCMNQTVCGGTSEGTPLFNCAGVDRVCCMTGTPTRIQPGK